MPITADTIQYYNRAVGFTTTDPLPSWGTLSFIKSADPDETTPAPVDVLPAGENFVDYSGFSYNRSETFIGSVTYLDVAAMQWKVERVIDVVDWTNLTNEEIGTRTLNGLTAFAQMADDVRAVIVYLHENEVIPGFYMDPVLTDTTADQLKAITDPAVQLVGPEQVFQTLPFQMTGTLFNPWGGELIDTARVRVEVDAETALDPADLAVTSGGEAITFTADGEDLAGWWGPDTGFPVAPGYKCPRTST